MSKGDAVQLQQLTAAGNPEKEKKGKGIEASGTVFDSNTHALYSTISEAQKQHTSYKSSQVRHAEGNISTPTTCPPTTTTENTTTSSYHHVSQVPPSCAGDSGQTGRGREEEGSGVTTGMESLSSSRSKRVEATNAMYEDHVLDSGVFKHQSVRADSYRQFGHVDKNAYKEPKVSYVTCRCKTQTLFATFFIITAILLAVASLALSIVLWLGIYNASTEDCNCPDNSAEFNAISAELQTFEKNNTALRRQLAYLQNISTVGLDISEDILDIHIDLTDLTHQLSYLQQRKDELTNRTHSYSANLANISIYDTCTTQREGFCHIDEIDLTYWRQLNCYTNPIVPVDIQGKFLERAQCAIFGNSQENNTLVATLEMIHHEGEQLMRCRCSKVIPGNDLGQSSENIECGLYTTRCSTRTDISTNVTIEDASTN